MKLWSLGPPSDPPTPRSRDASIYSNEPGWFVAGGRGGSRVEQIGPRTHRRYAAVIRAVSSHYEGKSGENHDLLAHIRRKGKRPNYIRYIEINFSDCASYLLEKKKKKEKNSARCSAQTFTAKIKCVRISSTCSFFFFLVLTSASKLIDDKQTEWTMTSIKVSSKVDTWGTWMTSHHVLMKCCGNSYVQQSSKIFDVHLDKVYFGQSVTKQSTKLHWHYWTRTDRVSQILLVSVEK